MDVKAIRERAEERVLMGVGDLPINTDVLNLLDALEEAIGFGGHRWDCDDAPDHLGFHLSGKKCSCGWAEVEKGKGGVNG